MKKVIISSILAICLLLSGGSVSASGINGDMSYEEGAQRVIITEEMKQREQEKLDSFRKSRRYDSYVTLPVTRYEQETNYYCGPATVNQVVCYVTGTYRQQSFYATELGTTTAGTDMTRITGVLNEYIYEDHYVYSSIGTRSEWLEKIRYSLDCNRPAVLDINTEDTTLGFPYTSEGHFVNVSGYDGSSGTVRITDPNDPNGNVWYPIRNLYAANNNHFRKAIIW